MQTILSNPGYKFDNLAWDGTAIIIRTGRADLRCQRRADLERARPERFPVNQPARVWALCNARYALDERFNLKRLTPGLGGSDRSGAITPRIWRAHRAPGNPMLNRRLSGDVNQSRGQWTIWRGLPDGASFPRR